MAILNINGVDMPEPSSFKLPQYDLDSGDTNRNELGILQRDRIRQGVYKIELEWRGITNEKLNILETAIEPPSLQVTFPTAAGIKTKTMYVGDRNESIVRYQSNGSILWNVSFNLIEY